MKPANIKLKEDGTVKVLDYGLAKALTPTGLDDAQSHSPTVTRNATEAGVILGTAPYMSPEQVRGKTVDKRADNWAFGCCLYEALTGKALFLGDTVSDTLARVLSYEPDWVSLPAGTPPGARALLSRCLEKDAMRRLRDIGEARIAVDDVEDAPSEGSAEAMTTSRSTRRAVGSALTASVTRAIFAGALAWHLKPPPPRAVTRFDIHLPDNQQLAGLDTRMLAISADGSALAYRVGRRGGHQLYLRSLDQQEARPIRGTNGAVGHVFSPDGESLAFWADDELRRIPRSGGTAVTLCSAERPFGVSWTLDDTIVFGQGPGGVWKVPANGGPPEVLIAPNSDGDEIAYGPQILPGGAAILFTLGAVAGWDNARIVAQSLETGERQILVEGGADARYVSSGHLIYARASTLFAVPFDPDGLAITGGPVGVVEEVLTTPLIVGPIAGGAQFTVSDTGSLFYVPVLADAGRRLVWVDRRGHPTALTERVAFYQRPRLSPDGKRLALQIEEGGKNDIWIYDIDRDDFSRLTAEGGNRAPVWSPDGKLVAFASDRDGDTEMYQIPTDFSGEAEKLPAKELSQWPTAWSPDGHLLYTEVVSTTNDRDFWLQAVEGEPRPLIQTSSRESEAYFSPDGRWVAYHSNISGRYEVYIQAFPRAAKGGKSPSTEVLVRRGRRRDAKSYTSFLSNVR